MRHRLLLPLLFTLTLSNAHAAQPPAPAEPSARTLAMADRCTDFTTNGWAFKSPRNFLQWLDVFTTPDIHLEFARRSLDPRQSVRTLSSLIDPGMPRNYLEWTNPAIYAEWLRSAVDSEFYAAVGVILSDPQRLARWLELPADPRVGRLLAQASSPNTLIDWLAAPNDPATQALFAKAADPANLERWLRQFSEPGNYAGLYAWIEQADR